MVGNQDRAKQGARRLFQAVSSRLEREPAASRPKVLLYGESLGSFGSESLFDDLDDMRGRADGALWVGPPRVNELWHRLTSERDAGSPVWQPTYQHGKTVRFGVDGATLSQPAASWEPPRIAYLQHPSDPVTWWTPDLIFTKPQLMDQPRGPDVSTRMPYVPVVTFCQVTIDMVLGANAPIGHGHMYGPEHTEAWALIAPPDGWSSDDTQRLLAAATTSSNGED